MKILITGAGGMLAQAVRKKFEREGEIILTDVAELDITDAERVKETIKEICPALVINCAAYTAVDKAETQEELAYKINADGPGNLARACAELGQTERWRELVEEGEVPEGGPVLVHISTDYVFGGAKPVTEEYSEDDEKAPETAYGRTKLAGEEQIVASGCNYYIFRTAWLYGQGGANFVRTMLSLGRSAERIVRVVCDQHGSPTYTEDLTEIIYQAGTKHIPYGVYNATDLGFTTWAEFTKKIYELAGIDCKVVGISSAEYEAKAGKDHKIAKRPLNSKMSKQKLLEAGVKVPTWEDGLKRYLKKEGAYEE